MRVGGGPRGTSNEDDARGGTPNATAKVLIELQFLFSSMPSGGTRANNMRRRHSGVLSGIKMDVVFAAIQLEVGGVKYD